jgi:nucleoside-diphosphate-sugar epimerase
MKPAIDILPGCEPAVGEIECIDYDLMSVGLGLRAAEVGRLFREPCDYWHFAASTDLSDRCTGKLEASNIQGVRNAVELFLEHAQPGSRFFHISTVYAPGRMSGLIFEEWPVDVSEDSIRFRTHYEFTKAAGELVIRDHLATFEQRSLEVAVLRLGQVVGHSRTGASGGTNSGIYDIAALVRRLSRARPLERLRIVASPGAALALVPVDVCVTWLARVSRLTSFPLVPIFALLDAYETSVDDFFASLSAESGWDVRRVSQEEFDSAPATFVERAVHNRLKYAGRYVRELIPFDRSQADAVIGSKPETDSGLIRLLMREFFLEGSEQV